jgi:hypothetical protein
MSSPFPPSNNPFPPSNNPFQPSNNPYQAPQPGNPQFGYGYQSPPPPQNNLAMGAMVVGILGILMGLCCPLIGFPLNVAAMIMGGMSLKPPNKGMAMAGLICGIVGLLLTIANAIAGVIIQLNTKDGQNPFGF